MSMLECVCFPSCIIASRSGSEYLNVYLYLCSAVCLFLFIYPMKNVLGTLGMNGESNNKTELESLYVSM